MLKSIHALIPLTTLLLLGCPKGPDPEVRQPVSDPVAAVQDLSGFANSSEGASSDADYSTSDISPASSDETAAPVVTEVPAASTPIPENWTPLMSHAQDAARGEVGGALSMAYAAWDMTASKLYRAWKMRLGTDPSGQDLLDIGALYYCFADSAGHPVQCIDAPQNSSQPRGTMGIEVVGRELRSFASLSHPLPWGEHASVELRDVPTGAIGTSQRPWSPVRASCFASHTQLLVHSYAQVHARLPESFEAMLKYFHQVPVGFEPQFSPQAPSHCQVVVRFNPTQQAIWYENTPAQSPAEPDVLFFTYDYETGRVNVDEKPLSLVPGARDWKIFVVANLADLPVTTG